MEDKIRQFFEENYKDGVVKEDNFRDQLSIYLKKEYVLDVLRDLKSDEELSFDLLADICSLDWLGQPDEEEGRFEVIYNLYSIKNSFRLFIKVRLNGKDPEIDTVSGFWQTANWLEREVNDLMGIKFTGHPDPRKIVIPDDMEGHPLRKDFPLTYETPKFNWNKDDPPEVIK